jgi:hypothetical protein
MIKNPERIHISQRIGNSAQQIETARWPVAGFAGALHSVQQNRILINASW